MIYPSDVYFNISVDGFMRFCDYAGSPVDFRKDGSIIPDYSMFEDVDSFVDDYIELSNDIFNEPKKDEQSVIRSLFTSNTTIYPNMLQPKEATKKGLKKLFEINNYEGKMLNCSFCGNPFALSDELKDNLYLENLSKNSTGLSKFPNAYHGDYPEVFICDYCKRLMLFKHLSSFQKNRFFVDCSHFNLNYEINKTLNNKTMSEAIGIIATNLNVIGIKFSEIQIVVQEFKEQKNYTFAGETAMQMLKPTALYILSKLLNKKQFKNVLLNNPLDAIANKRLDLLLKNAEKLLVIDDEYASVLSNMYVKLYYELGGKA